MKLFSNPDLRLILSVPLIFLSGCVQLNQLTQNSSTQQREPIVEIAEVGVAEVAAAKDPIPTQEQFDRCFAKQDHHLQFNGRYPTVWARIGQNLKLNHGYTAAARRRIDQQHRHFLRHPKYLSTVTERAEPYIFHIVEQVDSRGLPMEFALLPVIESGYDPFAYSSGKAAGLWQFIRSTGHLYGLKQTAWTDDRRDIVVSTDAALSHLKDLAKRYDGDWLLALAAYNAGPGTINKAIARNKKKGLPTDYWSLKLSKETSTYVPRLLAVSEIIGERDHRGLVLKETLNQRHFVQLRLDRPTDLQKLAKASGISYRQLRQLNPAWHYSRSGESGPKSLLVPLDLAHQARKNLSKAVIDQQWHYEVKPGDTLWHIARQHNTSIKKLAALNNLNLKRPLKVGQHLDIDPDVISYGLSGADKVGQRKVHYKVRSGDSLAAIAKRFSVSVKDISNWNSINPKRYIQPGQKLTLFVDVSRV